MKKSALPLFCFLLQIMPQSQAGAGDGYLPVSQQRALEQRADQVIEMNDALVQRTVQANGGNYFHQGKSKILIFNHKIYKDFTIRIISGSRLVIETEDGIFQMNVLNSEN